MNKVKRHILDQDRLPSGFPCHLLTDDHWCLLGKTVASFGTLEYFLGRAIFALTATRSYPEDEIEKEYEKWLKQLERSLYNPLKPLVDEFIAAAKRHPDLSIVDIDVLKAELERAAEMRNVLCHGHWPAPDSFGKVTPFYVNKRLEVWDGPIDVDFLRKLQVATAELCVAVVNVVTHMGYQFPGSNGPGMAIFARK